MTTSTGLSDKILNQSTFWPSDFAGFRRFMGEALRRVEAPEALVEEVLDVDNEGCGVAEALGNAWFNIQADHDDEWDSFVQLYIHDLVLDIADHYMDPMNYAPRDRRPAVDGPALARAVTKELLK